MMKINNIIKIILVYGSFMMIAQAAPLFQAGDIELGGTKWESIHPTSGVASYYSDGKSGRVEFTCELHGDLDQTTGKEIAEAELRPGKNFDNPYNAHSIPLHAGITPKLVWILTDENERNGNIKVFYAAGRNVKLQCKGKRLTD